MWAFYLQNNIQTLDSTHRYVNRSDIFVTVNGRIKNELNLSQTSSIFHLLFENAKIDEWSFHFFQLHSEWSLLSGLFVENIDNRIVRLR